MPDAARSVLALLALTVVCEWPIPAVAGEPDTTKACKMECPKFSENKYPSSILQSYTVSTCRAKTSIILTTKKNRNICANPNHDWVKKAMQNIDARTRYNTTTKKLPVTNRHSGEAKLEVEGHAQPTKKVSTTSHKRVTLPVRTTADPQPFVESGLSGVEATTSSASLTPQPETIADKSTLQPDSIVNHEIESETFEGHKRSGDHVTSTKKGLEDFARTTQRLVSPPMPFPGTDKTSTKSPALVSETLANSSTRPPMNSSISKLLLEFVTKDKTSMTIPTKLSNSSDQHRLFLSSSSANHKPQSVEGSTAQLPTDSSSPSNRQSSSDRNSLNSVQFQGVIDAESEGDTTETLSSIGTGRTFSKPSDTLQISGYHQETFIVSTSASISNTPPTTLDCNPHSQSMVQNYIIPVLSIGGILCVLLALGGLVYAKRNMCTKRSPKRQIQGLMYYPCDSQAESYPMEIV
ncbi:fractalkine [Ahaetulla prasina]|uniref:fractalkine n=1 Tax=Ahaetulla prasina TaxID=499056 RepID=UPI0026499819|nr:fractalkine [Ahaetulla prasina]